MSWERFTLTGKDIVPRITLRKNGQIGLSQSAISAYKLDKYPFIVLFIDKEQKRIGIKFTSDAKEEGVKKLRIHPAGGASIPGKSFLAINGLQAGSHYDCEFDSEENMLIAKYG